ncbi:MAG: TMEM165/GDT1 family protein [Rhodocyclaceae bacterium]|jgi:putative Ca2+/H+ antiporter (TMEM165/GDT1 family)|nr:TMEM165/GDT1 family protein [Rhodocyclaceae bacterium]
MEAFLTATALVAVAEIGDKTQLLSFVLAARLRRPMPIIAGILVATLLNHAFAGAVGNWVARVVPAAWTTWIVGLTFIVFGLWALIPDKLEDEGATFKHATWGVFATTSLAFFLAEMGDKTQFATVALGARFPELWAVVLGTTLGMMIANVPAVIIGEKLAHRLPLDKIRWAAAALFVLTGALTLLGAGRTG